MITVAEIAELVGGRVLGDPGTPINAFAPIDEAGPGDVTFARGEAHRKTALRSRASAVVTDRPLEGGTAVVVLVDRPDVAFSRIVRHMGRNRRLGAQPGIDPRAVVAEDAEIDGTASLQSGVVVAERAAVGARTVLFPGVYVGPGTRIGADCILLPNVVLMDEIRIGDRVILNAGVVIGADGFGYATTEKGVHEKVPQVGTVVIEDDVEVGANSCIDRARFRETRIRRGTKIDNLVQIAHNVQIGEHSLLAAHVGIAGSAKLGHHVVLGGHVGITDHVELGAGAQVAAYSGVNRSVPGGQAYMGVPAQPLGRAQRVRVLERRLPEIYERLRQVEARLAELARSSDSEEIGEGAP